ncbi:MAG: hypothetical protein HJHJAOHD_02746 [Flavobacteriales bacterium]|nr:hypothetical protein [Flavobacteriales bacterium]
MPKSITRKKENKFPRFAKIRSLPTTHSLRTKNCFLSGKRTVKTFEGTVDIDTKNRTTGGNIV